MGYLKPTGLGRWWGKARQNDGKRADAAVPTKLEPSYLIKDESACNGIPAASNMMGFDLRLVLGESVIG